MKKEELQEDKWYKFYPYPNDRSDIEWLMKAEGGGSTYAKVYISWYSREGTRQFQDGRGQFPGPYHYEEVTPQEYTWLALVERDKRYFPIEEMPKDVVINHYEIY